MLEQRLKSLLLHIVCARSIRTVNASFYKVQCFQDRKRQIDVLETRIFQVLLLEKAKLYFKVCIDNIQNVIHIINSRRVTH